MTTILFVYVLLLPLILSNPQRNPTVTLLSAYKPAYLSGISQNLYPEYAVDSNLSTHFKTAGFENDWILINLINIQEINFVTLVAAQNYNIPKVNISIGNGTKSMLICATFVGATKRHSRPSAYTMSCNGIAKFVLVQSLQKQSFSLSEVEIHGIELEIPALAKKCLNFQLDEQSYYEGTQSTGNRGKCKRWDTVVSNPSSVYVDFYKSNLTSYENYCRNPNYSSTLWCYAMDSSIQECDIPLCNTDDGSLQLLSYMKPTSMDTQFGSYKSQYGVDGFDRTWFSTNSSVNTTWWRVDLENLSVVTLVFVLNRHDSYGHRFANAQINIGMNISQWKNCDNFSGPGVTRGMYFFSCIIIGQLVEIRLLNNQVLHLSEVEVYGRTIVDRIWSSWTLCTSICADGAIYCNRNRTCTNPRPGPSGKNCTGENSKMEYCPIDGMWTNWTSCTDICASGAVNCYKNRTCTNPTPQHNGKNCTGENNRIEKCPIDGMWSNWAPCELFCTSEESTCIKTRTCTNPTPEYGGNNCSGPSSTEGNCPTMVPKVLFFLLAFFLILFISLLGYCWSNLHGMNGQFKRKYKKTNRNNDLYDVGSSCSDKAQNYRKE